MKFKYNENVRVISDHDNDGFYIGLEGTIKEIVKTGSFYQEIVSRFNDTEKVTVYGIDVDGENRRFYATEDELQHIL